MLLASILVISSCLLSVRAGPPATEVQGNDSGSAKSRELSDATAEVHTVADRLRVADITGVDHRKDPHVTITYSIWVGTNVSEKYTLLLHPVRNTSFYDVMILAASIDEHYQFEATEWPYGHYITMLAGYREDPANYLFWLIYQTPQVPDPASPPGNELLTPVGVDSLYVDEGDNYLFWLRNL
ncbi:uncharacterized protein CG3556-like [Schistocerca nitens]|uniref:uncharacterized protein CG3556-like n=1 Tax=Schistocerca nitens TaxID=7011 RepID=UPI00211892DA|nr:uncharacterized protein CG3556-like [Schistocerca nitens]